MNPFTYIAEGGVPSVFVPTVTAEFYATPRATSFESGLGGEWSAREDARLGRLARLTRRHGSRHAALRMFARPPETPSGEGSTAPLAASPAPSVPESHPNP